MFKILSFIATLLSLLPTTTMAGPYIKGSAPAGDHYYSPYVGANAPLLVAVGFAYGQRLLPEGFISPINDSISIEGATTLRYNADNNSKNIFFVAGMRWDFHLSPKWTVFARPESGLRVGDYSTRFFPADIGLGAFYRFSAERYLRFEYSDLTKLHFVGLTYIL